MKTSQLTIKHEHQGAQNRCIADLSDLIGCQHDDICALVKALRGCQVTNPLQKERQTHSSAS